MNWFKVWTGILNSTLVQEVGAAGVGTWTLILSLAANEVTPGSFKFKNVQHLARIFNMDPEILENHLKIFETTGRIKIRPSGAEFFCKVCKWQRYQRDIRKKVDGHNQQRNGKVDGQNQHKRREEEKREDEIRGEKKEEIQERETSPCKKRFFELLKNIPSYPFHPEEDANIFDLFETKIDILTETEKKITWWQQNPEALLSKKKSLRQQLVEFFLEEVDFQTTRKTREIPKTPGDRRWLREQREKEKKQNGL
jgi:hypothetical protein